MLIFVILRVHLSTCRPRLCHLASILNSNTALYCLYYAKLLLLLPNTKFVLNHFDPKAKNTQPFPPITLDGQVIVVSETAKYLKIILDRRLEFLEFSAYRRPYQTQIEAGCSASYNSRNLEERAISTCGSSNSTIRPCSITATF